MTTVQIDVQKLSSAITALQGLADSIDGARHSATTGSPIALPSLEDGTISAKARWLHDNVETLKTRRDLAILLDTKGSGHASYTVDADTQANVDALLSKTLAAALADLDRDSSDDDIKRVNGVLSDLKNDKSLMSMTFDALGADGTAQTLSDAIDAMRTGDGDIPAELIASLRTGLSSASNSTEWSYKPDYPHGPTYAELFANNLVKASVPIPGDDSFANADDPFPGNRCSALTYLLQDPNLGRAFIKGAADTLDTFESSFEDPDSMWPSAAKWYKQYSQSPLTPRDSGFDDPMAAVMQGMARHPDLGLEWFRTGINGDRQDRYFDKRDWSNDGYESISMAVESITTDLDNLKLDPEHTTEIASSFVDYVANSPGFNPDDAKAASPYIADLLKFYMPSVANTLDGSAVDGDPQTIKDVTVLGLGKFDYLPTFYLDDVKSLTGVAMSTPDGMQSMAEGVGGYTTGVMNGVASQLADDPDNIDLRTQLQNVLMNDAELRGFMTKVAGSTEIEGAEDAAARQKAWASLLGEVADVAPVPFSKQAGEIVGEWSTKVVDYGWGKVVELGQGSAEDALAWASGDKSPTAAYDDATAQAEAGLSQMNIESYRSLINAGVIDKSAVPDKWYDDYGHLKTYDEILKSNQISEYNLSATTGMSKYIPDESLENTYKDSFQDYYDKPED